MTAREHYQILGVPPEASVEEIRSAYRFKVLAFHPDRFSGASDATRRRAEEELRAVNEAFAVLSDPQARMRYDQARRGQVRPQPTSGPESQSSGPEPSPMGSWLQRIPRWVILLGLLIYVLSPFDLIPDFLPRLGLIDDLVAVLIVAYLLSVVRPTRPAP